MPEADTDKKHPPQSLAWLRWVIPLALVGVLLATEALSERKPAAPALDYSSFYSMTEEGKVSRVTVQGQSVTGSLKGPETVEGKTITTVEGLGTEDHPHALQRAFIAEQAMQCGYCLSGIMMSAAALLKRNTNPTSAEIKAALDRNLCRCGSHNRIVRAVLRAASEMRAS